MGRVTLASRTTGISGTQDLPSSASFQAVLVNVALPFGRKRRKLASDGSSAAAWRMSLSRS
jgi:hypothetical protein